MKPSSKEDEYPITLEFKNSIFRALIKLKENYQFDLTASNVHELFGFNKVILNDPENYGSQMPNSSQDTEMLTIIVIIPALVNTSCVVHLHLHLLS